jgi:hypothetical protein
MGRSLRLVVWLTILIVRGHNTSGLTLDHSLTGDVVKYAEGSGDQLESSPGLSPDRQGSDGDLLESSLGSTDDRHGSEGDFSGDEPLFDDLARIDVENFSEFQALELNSPASDHFDEPPKVGLPPDKNGNLLPENDSDPQVKPDETNEQELGIPTDLTSFKSKKIGSSHEYFGTDPISQNVPIVVEEIPVALPLVDSSPMTPTSSPASVIMTPIAAGAGEPMSAALKSEPSTFAISAAESTGADLRAAEPTISQPSGAESAGADLRAAEPTISQPSGAESTGADLRAAELTIYQPSAAEQAESDGQSATETAVVNPLVPETGLQSGTEVSSTWKPNSEEPSSAEQISGNQRNVETEQSKTDLQSGPLLTESEVKIASELEHKQKEAEVGLFPEPIHYPTELETNNSSEPGHIPTELEENNSSEPGHISTELEANNSSQPEHFPTELKADPLPQQELMPPESEVEVSSESGHTESEIDIAHNPGLDLTELEYDTNGGGPAFRLDMPTAEKTATEEQEEKEIAPEYRVTRPLMEDVDIRTFLEHHPVDEKRIAEVVKNITQYFEPAWFPEGPLVGSGATGNHVVRYDSTGKETVQKLVKLTKIFLILIYPKCTL